MEYAVPSVTYIICPIVLQDFYDDTFYGQKKSGGTKRGWQFIQQQSTFAVRKWTLDSKVHSGNAVNTGET